MIVVELCQKIDLNFFGGEEGLFDLWSKVNRIDKSFAISSAQLPWPKLMGIGAMTFHYHIHNKIKAMRRYHIVTTKGE